MPEPHAVVLFSLAALALLVIPGSSVLYIVTRSLEQGRTAGFVSVLGVHTAVKWAGAAYLVLLGIRRHIAGAIFVGLGVTAAAAGGTAARESSACSWRDGGAFAFGGASHIGGPSDPRCGDVCILDVTSA